jgi:hypothetical protein
MGEKYMKVNSKIYKGIEYIQLSDLPKDQQDLIVKNLNEEFFIKILVEKNVLSNCIQYKDYALWFDTFSNSKAASRSEVPVNSPSLEVVYSKA